MRNKLIFIFIITIASSCLSQESNELRKKKQELIIEEYLVNGAQSYNYEYQMTEWQNCLDEGLQKDSTIARLWQQKAMPYFKARKYEIGMNYVDKAVLYDREEYLPYRAFIKCIFSKQYKSSINDFEDVIKEFGDLNVMDHTCNFYIAICFLQLNEFEKANHLLKEYIDKMIDKNGEAWVNPTALFYYGIAKYELKEYNEAIKAFDRALVLYDHFSDAKFYKAVCLARIGGDKDSIKKLIKECKEDAELGYTIGEYNAIYETYPYQKRWNK